MSEPTKIPCPTCQGHGRVASHNGLSWKQWEGLPYSSDEMEPVRSGRVQPVVCPTCKSEKFVIETPAQ
jgi:Zn finger protein HypA/HybF involved in hydrogenase expression